MNLNLQKTILLVEDEPLIGMAESQDLKNYGYDVIHVLDSENAIKTMNENKNMIDIILMDINLNEEIDGPKTAEIILKEHDIPILFLSSHTEREIVEKTELITSYGYVVKDSGITVLDASIKMAFRLYDACFDLKNQKTDIKNKKKELAFYEKRYRRLFESAKDGILILDAENGMIVDVNPFLIEMLGHSKEQFLEKYIWDISAFKNIDYSKHLYKELQDKGYVRYDDLPLETANGSLIYVEFVCNVYLVGNKNVIQCNIRDITNRIQNEKILTNNINEKDALIKEIQHRIKNSFFMIMSLIDLKSRTSDSIELKNSLKELRLKVKSISDLYSLLYETDSFNKVHLKEYFSKIIESMKKLTEYITINNYIEDITVFTKHAAVYGMILVELLTNAVKHAFGKSQNGIINIELKKTDNTVLMIIKDNGTGLQNDFDINNIKTFGINLVNIMVGQLKGNIKFIRENGTKIIIECPI